MGAAVSGSLPDWAAEIRFDETPVDGKNGHVRVSIDTRTLTLGSVTDQAKGPEFFDVANHPKATFTADLLTGPAGQTAQGILALRGLEQPITLPFTLTITGDTARMTGEVTLDRRDFGIGAGYGAAMIVLSLFSINWRHEVSPEGIAMLWVSALFAYPLLLVGFVDDARHLSAHTTTA